MFGNKMEPDVIEMCEGTLVSIDDVITKSNGVIRTTISLLTEEAVEYNIFFPGIILADSIGSHIKCEAKYFLNEEDANVQIELQDVTNNRPYRSIILIKDLPGYRKDKGLTNTLRLIQGGK